MEWVPAALDWKSYQHLSALTATEVTVFAVPEVVVVLAQALDCLETVESVVSHQVSQDLLHLAPIPVAILEFGFLPSRVVINKLLLYTSRLKNICAI